MELQAQSAKCSTSNTSKAMADCSSIRIRANRLDSKADITREIFLD